MFMNTTKKTNVAARMIFGAVARPNHITMSGASAIFGME